MPSKSAAQAKLMNIAAHTKGGYGGVPQKVGEEFHAADKAAHAPKLKANIGVTREDIGGHEHLGHSVHFSGAKSARNPVQHHKGNEIDGLAKFVGGFKKRMIGA